ncbi:hypothetical protein GGX14DRAFT_480001 [Mycena pura]|uniref:Uncharacterized protein n=1 Tax=Mycena pura TaxID=153505 RepID=A0AAD6XZR8_9AGAR|nr:hypothetical protein GGX14DRAFT_480001 [Mycena pura]
MKSNSVLTMFTEGALHAFWICTLRPRFDPNPNLDRDTPTHSPRCLAARTCYAPAYYSHIPSAASGDHLATESLYRTPTSTIATPTSKIASSHPPALLRQSLGVLLCNAVVIPDISIRARLDSPGTLIVLRASFILSLPLRDGQLTSSEASATFANLTLPLLLLIYVPLTHFAPTHSLRATQACRICFRAVRLPTSRIKTISTISTHCRVPADALPQLHAAPLRRTTPSSTAPVVAPR